MIVCIIYIYIIYGYNNGTQSRSSCFILKHYCSVAKFFRWSTNTVVILSILLLYAIVLFPSVVGLCDAILRDQPTGTALYPPTDSKCFLVKPIKIFDPYASKNNNHTTDGTFSFGRGPEIACLYHHRLWALLYNGILTEVWVIFCSHHRKTYRHLYSLFISRICYTALVATVYVARGNIRIFHNILIYSNIILIDCQNYLFNSMTLFYYHYYYFLFFW